MSTVIRNGTVVTADLSYSADVLVDNGVITDIGSNLSGNTCLLYTSPIPRDRG